MSTTAGRTRPTWKVWAAVAVLVVVVAGLLHAWRNTNLLTADRLCGDLVSAEKADAVLPGSGRLDAEGDGLDEDLTDTVCRIEKSSVGVGSDRSELTVRVWDEPGDDLLGAGHLTRLPDTAFLAGEVTGGVDSHQGWALLPEKCWTAERPVLVRVGTTVRAADRDALAALVGDAARAVAAAAQCGDLPDEAGPLVPPASDGPRPVSEGRVCGLDGLSVRGRAPAGTKVLEAGQKAPAALWSCTLTLDDDARESVRASGFMTYTASRDPLLIAAVRKTPDTAAGTAPDGRQAEVVGPRAMVLPCADGGPLYLAVESGQQYLEAGKRHDGLPERDAYFAPFVKAATGTFGCAAPAAG